MIVFATYNIRIPRLMCNRTVINTQSVSIKPAAAENKQITVINSSSFGILFKGGKGTPYKPYNFKKRKLYMYQALQPSERMH